MSAKNLWGEWNPPETFRTPYATLKEQSALLDKMTNGLLIGDVQRSQDGNDNIIISFRIKAPALNNYTFSVLTVKHPAQLYPILVFDLSSNIPAKNCNTEEEFDQILHQILSSEEVRRVIASLLADIRVEVPLDDEF